MKAIYRLKDTSSHVTHHPRGAKAAVKAAKWANRVHPDCMVVGMSLSFHEASNEWEAVITVSHTGFHCPGGDA